MQGIGVGSRQEPSSGVRVRVRVRVRGRGRGTVGFGDRVEAEAFQSSLRVSRIMSLPSLVTPSISA